ncbi:hypothetical protein Cgig2_020164 [Carnegiea gigantea]|uniref:Uncharacterized protein n=1 Tax=Carnegiea gigantea TaxID=171969 RepID=A0A9Q1KXT0_9CARY|nr:hypothetical protein Cgig2_020164 [Carnegiea gigantea]
MPSNVNLIMSMMGSMQQIQPLLQPPLHLTPQPPVELTPQRILEPYVQATSQQSGGRIVPWSEHEMAVREKILIEQERSHFKGNQQSMSCTRTPTCAERRTIRQLGVQKIRSAVKAAEEAHQADEARQKEMQHLLKQVEEEMRAKEAKFENELAQEKATRQRDKEKVKSKISKLWRSSTALPDTTPSGDDDEDEPDTSDLGDSSHD